MADKTWVNELMESPLNMALLAASGYLIYKILCDVFHKEEPYVPPPKLVKDMTLKELKLYNGKDNEKICLAVKGEIFDVTRGASFYGPGGPYDVFAGREASRAFANFSTDEKMLKDVKDDLSDLNASEVSQLDDWYASISGKYDKVGIVLYEENVDEAKTGTDDSPTQTVTDDSPSKTVTEDLPSKTGTDESLSKAGTNDSPSKTVTDDLQSLPTNVTADQCDQCHQCHTGMYVTKSLPTNVTGGSKKTS